MVERDLAAPDAEVQEYCGSRLRGFWDAVYGVLGAVVTGTEPPAAGLRAVNDAMQLNPALELLTWDSEVGFRSRQNHPETRAARAGGVAEAGEVRLIDCRRPVSSRQRIMMSISPLPPGVSGMS